MKVLITLLLIANHSFALTGADILGSQSGDDIQIDEVIGQTQERKEAVEIKAVQIQLHDDFQIEAFNKWKALGDSPYELKTWMHSIFNQEYEKASHLMSVMKQKSPEKFHDLIDATSLYLLWKNKLNQTFFNQWLELSSQNDFLKTSYWKSLEPIVLKENTSDWFLNNSIVIGVNQKLQLEKIKDNNSEFNIVAQAWAGLRSGSDVIEHLKKLPVGDPIGFELSKTLVVDYARKGKLGAAAGILKKLFEPRMSASENTEEIVSYYMLLARLLYQAGALEASKDYYSKIPDESSKFLQARVERLWILLREGDMSKVKGELATLKLDMFADYYLPEVFLVGSIAHLKMCHFDEVKEAFDKYVSINKVWSQKIDENIKKEEPEEIEKNDFYLEMVKKSLSNLEKERARLSILSQESIEAVVPAIGEQKHWLEAQAEIKKLISHTQKAKTYELRKRWVNRKKILESSIRKMRFVKVEFISLMRKMARRLKENNKEMSDKITTFSAATSKKNQVKFPIDGVLFADELFHMSAEVKSLCLSGAN